jgi:flagellar motor switch protein FliM
MAFFDHPAASAFPSEPFDPFGIDLGFSNVDDFLPDFMFSIESFSTTPEFSARITELPNDTDMTPEMAMEIDSESSKMDENVPETQIQVLVDETKNRRKKRMTDITQNNQLQLQRRSLSFSKSLANEQDQRAQ